MTDNMTLLLQEEYDLNKESLESMQRIRNSMVKALRTMTKENKLLKEECNNQYIYLQTLFDEIDANKTVFRNYQEYVTGELRQKRDKILLLETKVKSFAEGMDFMDETSTSSENSEEY